MQTLLMFETVEDIVCQSIIIFNQLGWKGLRQLHPKIIIKTNFSLIWKNLTKLDHIWVITKISA